MTGTQQVLLLVVIAALLTICGVVWLEHRRHAADEQAYEDELNQQFGGSHDETTTTETLPPLPAEDLVGPDNGDRPSDEPIWRPDIDDTQDCAVSQAVPAADPGGSGSAADASSQRLTPAQRRRAVKKGRIPRNVPAVVGRLGDTGHHSGAHNLPSPDGISSDLVAVDAARGYRAGEFHPHAERIPQPLEVWDPLMRAWMPVFPTLLESARHEAHFRQWESEMGPQIDRAWDEWAAGFWLLEQTDWLETAA